MMDVYFGFLSLRGFISFMVLEDSLDLQYLVQ